MGDEGLIHELLNSIRAEVRGTHARLDRMSRGIGAGVPAIRKDARAMHDTLEARDDRYARWRQRERDDCRSAAT